MMEFVLTSLLREGNLMKDILEKYGKHLADEVLAENHRIAELDIDSPIRVASSHTSPLLDYLVIMLFRRNSILFISNPLEKSTQYVNSLSLAFRDPLVHFKSLIDRQLTNRSTEYYREYFNTFAKNDILRLDMKRITDDGQIDTGLWDKFILALEEHKDQYTFELHNLSYFYDTVPKDTAYFNMFDEYWTKANGEPVFIVSMDWEHYVNHIELGKVEFRARHIAQMLFTPRPSHLPKYPIDWFLPDNRFQFK